VQGQLTAGTNISIVDNTISASSTGGATDHGELTGLADDDHTQYYNQTRGDARYALTGHDHSGVYQPADADIPTVAASQAEMEAGTETALRSMSPANVKQAIEALSWGPAFSATCSTAQALEANVAYKVNFDTEEFDTNNCYDTTNKRFQPNVAGYYLIVATVGTSAVNRGVQTRIFKNGEGYSTPVLSYLANTTSQNIQRSTASVIMYLNGSTDYVEIYVACSTASDTSTAAGITRFTGTFLRGA
jgi:hypothetical protein